MRWLLTLIGIMAIALGVILLERDLEPPAPPLAPAIASVSPTPRPSASVAANAPMPTPIPPIPDGYRIQIARLGIDLPIAEGDVDRDAVRQQTPENFAFHLPGTSLPGDKSNCYLYAHARRGMFLSLWNARVGDEVIVSTPDGRALKYVVSEVHPRVPPDDVSWTEPGASERLTLQTSTGPNPGDPRFVVVALPD